MANLLFAPENLTRSGLETPEGVSLHAGWYYTGMWGSSGEPSGPLIRHRQVRENYSALLTQAHADLRRECTHIDLRMLPDGRKHLELIGKQPGHLPGHTQDRVIGVGRHKQDGDAEPHGAAQANLE